uniref:Protein trm112 n=1 Tax=Rhizophora mucronata TaxID=61149 RepID=A0A2P2IQF0_RHIMU
MFEDSMLWVSSLISEPPSLPLCLQIQ